VCYFWTRYIIKGLKLKSLKEVGMSEPYSNFTEKVEEEQVEEEQVEEEQVEEEQEESKEPKELDDIIGPLFPPSYLRGLYGLACRCFRYFMDTKPKFS
jgi:hypothetical protein